jgi:tetratricopeptide (TPR) repeat protein
MKSVFISYASADSAVAAEVCRALESAGIGCWIAQAIGSPHVLREVERASSKKRTVLSVRLDVATLPPELEHFLSANHWLDATGGPVERVLPALVEAVRLDPKFALAWASLAHLLAQDNANRGLVFRRGDLAAKNADDRHAAMDWEYAWQQARNAERAASLDPLGHAWTDMGFAQCYGGNLDASRQAMQHALELYPTESNAHFRYANVLLLAGHADDAAAVARQETLEPMRDFGVALALDAQGHHAEAEQAIGRIQHAWGAALAYQIAYFYAARNDREQTFSWLQRASRQHDGGLTSLKVDPRFSRLNLPPGLVQLRMLIAITR